MFVSFPATGNRGNPSGYKYGRCTKNLPLTRIANRMILGKSDWQVEIKTNIHKHMHTHTHTHTHTFITVK